MKIQTADRCNKKSSSFTNTRILSTKDNLTPRLQGIIKAFPRVTLLLKRLLNHNLPVHVITKILVNNSTDVDYSPIQLHIKVQ